jgi:hypothetical protein
MFLLHLLYLRFLPFLFRIAAALAVFAHSGYLLM